MGSTRRIKGLLAGVFALLLAIEASAHSWQENSPPLGPDDVATVVTALEQLAAAASEAGWTADAASGDSMATGVYAFAAEAGQLGVLPAATERVLVTFEALEKGIVTPEGRFAETADSLLWYEYLHLGDISAVAEKRDALQALRTVFVRKAN